VISFLFLPESPVYLLRKNQVKKAEISFKSLRGQNYDPQPEIIEFQKHFEETLNTPESSFFDEIRKRETSKAFIIIISLFLFFQLSGINAVTVYATTIFAEAEIEMDPSIATIVTGAVQVLATLSTTFVIDRCGRIFLLIFSLVSMIFGLSGIATFFVMKSNNFVYLEYISWLPLPSICIFVVAFSVGLGPVPFIILGEIFSSEAKKSLRRLLKQ
jgi:hypothetical protein